jgi:ABC-type branched-subunit amino acid transport system substrate-binding protein
LIPFRSRALASVGAACLAALAVAGCSTSSSSGSSSSSNAVTVTGHTLRIYLSEPHDLRTNAVAQDVIHAEQMAFSAHHSEVTDFRLVLQPVRGAKLSDNARAAIIDASSIAYLGEVAPGASDQTVGITNALALLQVSPTDNALELSEHTPAVSGSPHSYYEQWGTYGQTFARVVPSGSDEAKAQVAEMKKLGVKRLEVADDGSDYGKAIAHAVSADAQASGLTIEPSPDEEVQGYFYGAQSPPAAATFFNHIATMAADAKLFGSSSLNTSAFPASLSATAAKNMYVSIPGYLPKDLTAEGKSFETEFKTAFGHTPNVQAIFGYEAMSALLRVLQKEGKHANNRTAVVNAFLAQRNVSSVLGTYSMDSAGNISLDGFVFARVSGGKLEPFAAAPLS